METRLSTSPDAPATPRTTRADAAPDPSGSWEAVLAGVREGVLVCDRHGVVRAANPAARALLPDLVVGELVESGGCAALTRVVHAGAGTTGPDGSAGQDLEIDAPDGVRRVRVRGLDLADDRACWYLHDVTDDHRRADTLLAAEERGRFLADTGRALHGVLHLDRTVRAVAELAVPRLGAVALVLVHPGGDTVHWARAEAGRPRAATGRLGLTDLRAAPRLLEVLTGDATADDWSTVELADLDVWAPGDDPAHRRLAAVPVPTTGIARAVLVLGDEQGAAVDDPARRDLAAAYASRAGAALAAAALFREQSHLGAVLQESLAPPALPTGTGLELGAAYRPARETLRVGGDFYEVLGPRDGVVPFLLGDVCGKGIDASVLSGRVRQSLHALRLLERDPARLLELLNTALLDAALAYGEDPRFATMVLGEARVTSAGVTLDLATGGHPPPLVLRADGTVETVEVEGMLVGAVREAHFGRALVELAPGEMCLLYSDGVTEARGPGGFYGEERLEAALGSCAGAPAAVVCERVAQLLSEWLDGRDHDDVALLALQAAA